MGNEKQYDAFISYSRKDKAFAVKLEKVLEDYRPPKDLAVPQRHLNIFRDEEDLIGTEYYQAIDKLLQDSAKLIVICSPNSRHSQYVNDEIQRFVRLNSAENIIPLIVAGVPDNEAKVEQETEKAFPTALFDVMEMPLAKDYRGFDSEKAKIDKSPFENAWYGLLADLYNKTRREVEERDRKKRLRQRRIKTGIACGVIITLAGLAGIALWQKLESDQQKKNVQIQLAQKYWEIGRQAREQDNLLLFSHFLAEAGKSTPDQNAAEVFIQDSGADLQAMALESILSYQKPVQGARFDSVGESILTWSGNITARLWKALLSGQPMRHGGCVNGAVFNQTQMCILTWSDDGTARLWETETGKPLGQPMKHEGKVRGAVFDQTQTRILTWSNDGTVRLWKAETGKPLGRKPADEA